MTLHYALLGRVGSTPAVDILHVCRKSQVHLFYILFTCNLDPTYQITGVYLAYNLFTGYILK